MEEIVNCDSCLGEYSANDLVSVKLGNQIFSNLKICLACNQSDPEQAFEEAREILSTIHLLKGSGDL